MRCTPGVESHFVGSFQQRTAKAAHQHGFFDGDDETGLGNHLSNHFTIDRFDESCIDHADVEAFGASVSAASRQACQERCRRQ